jgi:hypothetical protein
MDGNKVKMNKGRTMKVRMILVLLIISVMLVGQNSNMASMKGIRASLQSNQFDLCIPYFYTSDVEITPALSVIHANHIGSDLVFGLSLRKYYHISKVSTFAGLRGGMLLYTPNGEDSTTDYYAGLLGGAEYFIDRNLSLGIELQLNGSFSDEFSWRFGNPNDTIINTASAITLSIYW